MTTRDGRIRAMRMEEPQQQIAARAAALRPFIGRTRDERAATLARLLRQERRASLRGLGYDAARHAVLSRLLTECGLRCASGPNKTGRRE